jgi:hypothetical protein
MIGFLFSPRVPRGEEDANCVSVTESGPIRIHKNCDSEEFQYVAANPGLLLSQRRYRQSRPLYAVIGWTLSRPFHWIGLASMGRGIVANAQQTYQKAPTPGAYLPEYAGLVLLNFIVLLASVILFLRLSASRGLFDPLTLFPLVLIVVNSVTKAFFWTPHSQMLNVLIPVASLALYRWMLVRERDITSVESVTLGLLIGVGALAYGAFAVMAAGAALCVAIRRGGTTLVSRIVKAALLVGAFFVPAAGWILFVRLSSGTFYSLEINLNRDFVWIIDLIRSGNGSRIFWTLLLITEAYGETLRYVWAVPVIAVALLSALLAVRGSLNESLSRNKAMVESIAFYLAPAFLFFWMLGLYYSRLSWSLVPPLAVLIAIATKSLNEILGERGKSLLQITCVLAAVFYAAFWYVTPGPWS